MTPKREGWIDKCRNAAIIFGLIVAVVGGTVGAITYFAPRGETNEKIQRVEQLAGMTQKELNLWQLDSLIERNRQQHRQITIEENRSGNTQRMKQVFDSQKRDLEGELEVLKKKREWIEKGAVK